MCLTSLYIFYACCLLQIIALEQNVDISKVDVTDVNYEDYHNSQCMQNISSEIMHV